MRSILNRSLKETPSLTISTETVCRSSLASESSPMTPDPRRYDSMVLRLRPVRVCSWATVIPLLSITDCSLHSK